MAAFTTGTLNKQPMRYYQPFTIIKDAQLHGLKVLPVDVMPANCECTIEDSRKWAVGSEQKSRDQRSEVSGQKNDAEMRRREDAETLIETTDHQPMTTDHCLRLGLLCVRGLREDAGRAIVQARAEGPFTSIDDLNLRVSELRKNELRKLAAVGALNFIQADVRQTSVCRPCDKEIAKKTSDKLKFVGQYAHRRDALWQVERVTREAGPLYEELEENGGSPLVPMTLHERLNADLRGTGMTIGQHPMAHQRARLDTMRVTRASDLKDMRNGMAVKVAGWVIVRQRPGTAKGFV